MPKHRFRSKLRKISGKPLRIKAYRVIVRNLPPLSLEGSLLAGGRYNPPYQFGALYCGKSEAICWAEIEKKLEGPLLRKNFSVTAIRTQLQKVLDLSDPEVLSLLKIDENDLVHPSDYLLTRAIASEAREAGFEAVIAPASTGKGHILAVFSDRLKEGSNIKIVKQHNDHAS